MSFRVCFFSTKRILFILLMVFSLAHQMESKKGMVRRRRVEDPALIASIQRAIKEVILPEPCDRECATKILKDSKHRVMRDEITFFTIMEGTFLFLNWISRSCLYTHLRNTRTTDASSNFSGPKFLKMVFTVVAQTVYYVLAAHIAVVAASQ